MRIRFKGKTTTGMTTNRREPNSIDDFRVRTHGHGGSVSVYSQNPHIRLLT